MKPLQSYKRPVPKTLAASKSARTKLGLSPSIQVVKFDEHRTQMHERSVHRSNQSMAPAALLFPLALAACGGSGSEVVEVPPIPEAPSPGESAPFQAFADKFISDTAITSYDFAPQSVNDGELIAIKLPESGPALTAISGAATAGYVVAEGEFSDVQYLATIGTNDDATVSTVYADGAGVGGANAQAAFISVERLGNTSIPTSGSAAFSGDYLGNLTTNLLVRGDVSLEANFEDWTVSGVIENREVYNKDLDLPHPGYSTTDVHLELGEIGENGQFSGAITGGVLEEVGDLYEPSDGYYTGYITGADGESVAGGIRNRFIFDEVTFYEIGTFLAE